jgi:hypothetical protein
MGWRDRDWAKWTDEEREWFYGSRRGGRDVAQPTGARRRLKRSSSRLTKTIAVAVACSLGAFAFLKLDTDSHPSVPMTRASFPPVVYGSDLRSAAGAGGRLLCTRLVSNNGTKSCVVWSILRPEQTAREARPLAPGTFCFVTTVDQRSGSWVCASHEFRS